MNSSGKKFRKCQYIFNSVLHGCIYLYTYVCVCVCQTIQEKKKKTHPFYPSIVDHDNKSRFQRFFFFLLQNQVQVHSSMQTWLHFDIKFVHHFTTMIGYITCMVVAIQIKVVTNVIELVISILQEIIQILLKVPHLIVHILFPIKL